MYWLVGYMERRQYKIILCNFLANKVYSYFCSAQIRVMFLAPLLNPFQIIRRFGFSRYIIFTMYLDIAYIYVHSKYNLSRAVKTSYSLERSERVRIC